MTSRTDLEALAVRVEAAESDGEMFAIDCEIERLIFDRQQGMIRRFTASIDAALQLVPEGWHLFSLGETRFMIGGPWLAQLDDWQEIPARTHAAAATAALAITAAALRARCAS